VVTDLVVIVECPDDEGPLRGRFNVGRLQADQDIGALVLDAWIAFHPANAEKDRVLGLGGDIFVDHGEASIRTGEKSGTYGTEPGRQMTRRAPEAALPTYNSVAESALSSPGGL